MSEWKPKFKYYPHFDEVISAKKVNALVKDPNQVAQNSFYPFMRYNQRWQPFRGKERSPTTPKPAQRNGRLDLQVVEMLTFYPITDTFFQILTSNCCPI